MRRRSRRRSRSYDLKSELEARVSKLEAKPSKLEVKPSELEAN